MSEKFFVAYIAFWAIVCFLGGIALLKNFFDASLFPFLAGLFLLGMGSVYALMFVLGIRAIRRKDQQPEH